MSAIAERPGELRVKAGLESQDLYRLVLLRKNASEFLVVGAAPPFILPFVEIPKWKRVAEYLTAAVRERYGIAAICLFAPSLSAASANCGWPLYEVMETRDTNWLAREDSRWLSANSFSDRSFVDRDDSIVITSALRQMAEFRGEKANGPFGRPGWIEELLPWVQHEIDPYGLRLTGEFQQFNASPTFALLRLATTGSAVWFKAVGAPNVPEFSISVALSRLFPGFVPTVVATRPAWNGWLTMEFDGSPLGEAQSALAWKRAAETLARLQVESLGRSEELFKAQCRDLRVNSLLEWVDPFTEVVSRLMEQQPKTPPATLNREQLATLARQVKDVLRAWEQLNIPDTLGHMDFNPWNILCSDDQCVFLDWAEALIGPPFLTLEYLLQHLANLRPGDSALNASVVKAYQANWRNTLSDETVSAAHELAPVLAVFAYAAASPVWRDSTRLEEPRVGAHLRSLTRRVNVEMRRLQEGRKTCCI